MKVGDRHYRSIWVDDARDSVHIIDQTRLPFAFETLKLDSSEAVAEAIKAMRVRGAPLIGVAAAFGLALAITRDPSDESISRASNLLRIDYNPALISMRSLLACARRGWATVRRVGMQRRRTIKKESTPARALQTSHVVPM